MTTKLTPQVSNPNADLSGLRTKLDGKAISSDYPGKYAPSSDGASGESSTKVLKGETFLSRMLSAVNMVISATIGIPLALAASAVLIPVVALATFFDAANLHTKQYFQFKTNATHDPIFEKVKKLSTGLLFGVWRKTLSPFTRTSAAVLDVAEDGFRSESSPIIEDPSERLAKTYGAGPSPHPIASSPLQSSTSQHGVGTYI